MKALNHLFATVMICVLAGCTSSRPERIVTLQDTEQNLPAAKKTLLFLHSRESWYPGADVPLFGPATEIVAVTLDANGEAHIHLRRVSWWARIDDTKYGTSIKPSNLRDGGTFRLYGPPPFPADTNLYPSKYVLTIKKP
jgi:hypothetical protein